MANKIVPFLEFIRGVLPVTEQVIFNKNRTTTTSFSAYLALVQESAAPPARLYGT